MTATPTLTFPLREGFYILESDSGWFPIRVLDGLVLSLTNGRSLSPNEAREFINGYRDGLASRESATKEGTQQ